MVENGITLLLRTRVLESHCLSLELSSASSMTLTFLCLNFFICKMGIGTYLPLWAVGKRKLAHIHQSLQQYLEHSEPTIKISHKYYLLSEVLLSGLPRWLSGKESACQCRRLEFYPWVRKIPWRRDWQLLPGECYGQRSLVGYSPWVQKELDTTQQINDRGPALTSNSYVKMETRVLSFHLVPQFKSSVGSYLTGKELKPSAMK